MEDQRYAVFRAGHLQVEVSPIGQLSIVTTAIVPWTESQRAHYAAMSTEAITRD